jgi:hypothetical protein
LARQRINANLCPPPASEQFTWFGRSASGGRTRPEACSNTSVPTVKSPRLTRWTHLLFGSSWSAPSWLPPRVSKRLQFVRTFFHDARRRHLIPINPFSEVTAKAVVRLDQPSATMGLVPNATGLTEVTRSNCLVDFKRCPTIDRQTSGDGRYRGEDGHRGGRMATGRSALAGGADSGPAG